MIDASESESFTPDALGQLDVSSHDGHSLCVNSAEVSVFEEGHHVGFSCLLQAKHSRWLES